MIGAGSSRVPRSTLSNFPGSCWIAEISATTPSLRLTLRTRKRCAESVSDSRVHTHSASGTSVNGAVTVRLRTVPGRPTISAVNSVESTVKVVISAVRPCPTAELMIRVCDTPLGRFTVNRSPGRTPSSASTVTTVAVADRTRPPIRRPARCWSATRMMLPGRTRHASKPTANDTERVSIREVSKIHFPTRLACARDVHPNALTSTCFKPYRASA
ncbi:hypothetical protein D3C85_994170 [compost metagenome]